MEHKRRKSILLLCLLLLTFLFLAKHETGAQSSQLILEHEQHWETYGVGGTCIPGSHNLFVADVNDDGVIEIITGGFMYYLANATRTLSEAPLKIWNWSGQNITLEKSLKWKGGIICVHAGDVNGDGVTEILTAGAFANSTGMFAQVRIWNWDGEALVLKSTLEGSTAINSIFVSDLDKDGALETVIVGRSYSGNQSVAQLGVWKWNGNGLTLRKSKEWHVTNETSANSVYTHDLDNDGVAEIITAGYANNLKMSSGQLRVWHWDGEDMVLKANEEWRLKDNGYGLTISGSVMGNTMVNNVKVGDVDEDGTPEIVTGGFAYDGEKVEGQLRIWNWTGQTLVLEKSQEWVTQDIAEVKCISINDVDKDERDEIVTSGFAGIPGSFFSNATTPDLAQLRVWSWDGAMLTLEQSKDWYVDEGACAWNVATGDVDRDGVTEIITVGCIYQGTLCDPDMRIWSVSGEASPQYALFVGVGIGVAIALGLIVVFFLVRKTRRCPS